jgi:hypothetical protein
MLVSRRLVVGFCDCVWVFVTVCGFCWKFCDGVWFYWVGPRAGKIRLVTVSELCEADAASLAPFTAHISCQPVTVHSITVRGELTTGAHKSFPR